MQPHYTLTKSEKIESNTNSFMDELMIFLALNFCSLTFLFLLFSFFYGPVPPVIEPFSFQDGLAEGARTRTVCGVSRGDSPLVLRWLKDGDPLSPSLGANTSSIDPYTSILSIPSLSSAHSGEYTCVASNQASEVKFTASLQVKGRVYQTFTQNKLSFCQFFYI